NHLHDAQRYLHLPELQNCEGNRPAGWRCERFCAAAGARGAYKKAGIAGVSRAVGKDCMSLKFNIRHLEQHNLTLDGELSIAELELESLDELIHFEEPVSYDLE